MSCDQSKNAAAPDAGRAAQDYMNQYLQAGQDLTGSVVQTYQKLWDNYSRIWSQVLEPYREWARCGCEIPETPCPPRCACVLQLQGCPGDRRSAVIRVKNTSQDPIRYTATTTPFESCCREIDLRPSVTPESAEAKPGQSVTFRVEVPLDAQLESGRTYEAEVRIAGKYERCVKIELQLAEHCEPCCAFEHGDIPQRISADHWYRHFQCTNPCFEPVRQSNPNRPVG